MQNAVVFKPLYEVPAACSMEDSIEDGSFQMCYVAATGDNLA